VLDNLKIEKGKEISLRNFFKGNHANIELFLDISIKLTQRLGEIHHNGIIHRNLTPDNIFINIDNKEVKITDFSNAILYSADNSKTMIKSNFTGDIKYLSPEQSAQKEGPLGFSVDYYSLGVIFYEMLTGKLPFEADSTAEWVQVHATRIPEKPNAINSQIPSIISEITMKLLSKNAHERYQTAYGLLRDLMECRRQWHAKGNIEPFKLGEFDITPHFKLPTRLFGRKREAKALQKAFERACSGEGGLIFISGCAGIGKTMLINEIVKPLAVSKGYYAYGKFEQLRQNVPYAAISSALTSVVRQLMTESKDKLNEWKREIQRAIGNNGALITEIIPNLNILIGHQPSVEMLQPKEAINRFLKVFDDFIKVFSKMNTPLVIFLDDLQWADAASLRLLKFISKNVDSRFLLIIGAYRDNEIEPTHPLQAAIEEIEKEEISFMQIQLFPLNLMDVTEFIAETFRCNKEKAELLAKILYRKTYGNPLFLSQMLISIYNQRLITFNIKQGSWEWKSESINRLQIPDDVLDLILARLKKLKKEQLDILKLASCIGNKFNIKTLAAVSQKAEAEVAVLMEPVIAEGLVIVLTDEKKEGFPTETDTENYIFEFLHDRVSQAVYTLLTDKEKKVAHLKVGHLILQSTKQEEFNDRILTAMDHINRGIDLVTDSQERLKLAQYNLVAGRKAKASAAFDTAAKCFKAGITLLPLNAWELCYDLCYDLYVEHAQCEFLIGNTAEAKKLFELIISRANNELDKADVYGLQMLLYTGKGKYFEAVEIGIKALKRLGMTIPARPSMTDKLKELLLYKVFMIGRKIEDLYKLPEMKDPVQRKVAELLIKFIFATCTDYPDLYALAIVKAGNHTLRYGRTEMAPIGFIGYSIVEGSVFGNYAAGERLGNVAIKLTEKYDKIYPKCIVYFTFGAIICHWSRHAKVGIDYLQKAVKYAFEAGDVLIIGYSHTVILENKYIIGTPLSDIICEISECRNYVQKVKHENLSLNAAVYNRAVSILTSDHGFHNLKLNKGLEEESFLQIGKKDKASLAAYYYTEMQIQYLAGNYREALAVAEKIKDCAASIQGFLLSAECNFYYSLIITALYEDSPINLRKKFLKTLKNNQKMMKRWSVSCAENFLHKFQLVEAERMRIFGKKLQAEELYEKAIQAARDNGYKQNEAIACELAARFYFAEGKVRVAKAYLSDALKLYSEWGALAKVREIRERYAELFADILTKAKGAENNTEEALKNSIRNAFIREKEKTDNLELSILQNTISAIIREFKSDPENILKAAMRCVFATKGFLIIEKEDELFIEAEIDSQSNLTIVESISLKQSHRKLSKGIVRYVANTQEPVIINNSQQVGIFTKDPYVSSAGNISILCLPLHIRGIPVGVLYLENNLMANVFTKERLELLMLLLGQTNYIKALEDFLSINKLKEEYACTLLVETLTDREIEIIKLLAEGLTNKEIAKRLDISNNTVKTHIKNIYGKLQVSRRIQAVQKAKELNLI